MSVVERNGPKWLKTIVVIPLNKTVNLMEVDNIKGLGHNDMLFNKTLHYITRHYRKSHVPLTTIDMWIHRTHCSNCIVFLLIRFTSRFLSYNNCWFYFFQSVMSNDILFVFKFFILYENIRTPMMSMWC